MSWVLGGYEQSNVAAARIVASKDQFVSPTDEEKILWLDSHFSSHIGAPFWTIKIYSESSRLIVVKITVKHCEAP